MLRTGIEGGIAQCSEMLARWVWEGGRMIPVWSNPFKAMRLYLQDKGLKYNIVEDESHNVKALECFGKLSEEDRKAIERYGAWVKKVTVPPPD